MKFVNAFSLSLLGLFSSTAQSQPAITPRPPSAQPPSYEVQRADIEVQRNLAQAQFDTAAVLCYQKFAVNDCLQDARNIRRDRLAELRLQSLALRDAQARQKAAERLQAR